MRPAGPKLAGPVPVAKERLDSWKEIAGYLNRDVRTVQRWERDFALPVQRLPGGPKAGVFALRAELDAWRAGHPDTRDPQPRKSSWLHSRLIWGIAAATVLLVLAMAAYAMAAARNPGMLALQDTLITPFATSYTVQICPAWSPDGKSIAYVGNGSGFPQIFVQTLESTTPLAITNRQTTLTGGADPTWCRAPVWSPDSQWLYFSGGYCGGVGILRVSAGGGDASLIQPHANSPAISRDGKTLVFLARSPEDEKLRLWYASPPDGPRRGYQPEPFAAGVTANIPYLTFAPDGRHILSVLNVSHTMTYRLLPWPPGPARRIFPNAERAVGSPALSWMPDSRHLIFAAGLMGMGDSDSGRYWPIAVQHPPMQHPTVSPNGSRVAYQSAMSHADVIAVPLNGGPVQTLLGSMSTEQEPAASPVAPQLVYITNKRHPSEIWLRNLADGTDRLLVSPHDVQVRGETAQLLLAPEFSPDGARVAFTAVSPAASAVFIVPATGGSPVRARGGADMGESQPTWSPDGKWIAFISTSGGVRHLLKVRAGSTEPPEDLAPDCGCNSPPEWSPTGEWIAASDESSRTVLVSADGKTTRPLGGTGVVAWARDGKTLYRMDPVKHALMATDIATGTTRELRQLGDLLPYSGPQPGLRASVTSDGANLVYSVLRPREEIWILENIQIHEPWFAWLLPLVQRR
jgi:Tol biopolymer transport system component